MRCTNECRHKKRFPYSLVLSIEYENPRGELVNSKDVSVFSGKDYRISRHYYSRFQRKFIEKYKCYWIVIPDLTDSNKCKRQAASKVPSRTGGRYYVKWIAFSRTGNSISGRMVDDLYDAASLQRNFVVSGRNPTQDLGRFCRILPRIVIMIYKILQDCTQNL